MRHEERKIKKREKIDSKKRVNEKREQKKMMWCDKEESEEKRRRKQACNEISLLGNYEISFNRVGFRFHWVQVIKW